MLGIRRAVQRDGKRLPALSKEPIEVETDRGKKIPRKRIEVQKKRSKTQALITFDIVVSIRRAFLGIV